MFSGSTILGNMDGFNRAVEMGGQIAVHTWSHPPMTTQSDMAVLGEIGWTMQVRILARARTFELTTHSSSTTTAALFLSSSDRPMAIRVRSVCIAGSADPEPSQTTEYERSRSTSSAFTP